MGERADSLVVLGLFAVVAGVARYFMSAAYGRHVDGSLEQSDWHPKNLSQHPDKTRYIRERLAWASQTYDDMKKSFAALN